MMRIPQKIDPCPIIEAIIEIRFMANVHPSAVFGLIYNEFKTEFSDFNKLPILQLPESILAQDPNLKFKPHFKSEKNGFILQVGPDVISLINTGEYVGWTILSERIKSVVEKFRLSGIISNILRIGTRYINFFESIDIFNEIKLKLMLSEEEFKSEQVTINSTLETGDYLTNLKIINNADVSIGTKKELFKGSVVDIDTFITNDNNQPLDNMIDIIEGAHLEEKKLFFTLLEDQFLETLNPTY